MLAPGDGGEGGGSQDVSPGEQPQVGLCGAGVQSQGAQEAEHSGVPMVKEIQTS